MPESSRGHDREVRRRSGLSETEEKRQREREEVENEEVAIRSLPVFDQCSMGN